MLLLVSFYEFGQFLRILLWIAFPIAILSVIVTTYVHYLQKRRQKLVLHPPLQAEDNTYRGVLWLKNKYEHDMGQATEKFDHLKKEFGKLEKKYLELLVSERHGTVDLLSEQLLQASQRTKDMLTSLDAINFLLMKMHNKLEMETIGSSRSNDSINNDKAININAINNDAIKKDATDANAINKDATNNDATNDNAINNNTIKNNTINMGETKIASWAESSSAEQFSQESIALEAVEREAVVQDAVG